MICNCGSNQYAEEIYDARGIYVARVCDDCREKKLASYRPEIFDDPNYWVDEPIDED